MAQETLSALNFLTKIVYEDPADQIDSETVLTSLIAKARSKENLTGLFVQFPVEIGLPESIGFQPENGPLPTPGILSGTVAQVYAMAQYGTVQVSGRAADQIRAGEGAYRTILQEILDSALKNAGLEKNRVLFNDGSGAMGQIASIGGAGPYTLTLTPGSNPWNFRVNMNLVAYSARTGGTLRAGTMVVSAVDYENGIVTVTTEATGLAANDFLFNANSAADNSSGTSYFEPMGLLGIVDDGTYVGTLQGIARATYPLWKANALGTDGAGTAFSTKQLRQAFTRSMSNGGKIDHLISSPGVRDAYVEYIEPDRRYDPSEEIDGGFTGVAYTSNGRKTMWVVDKQCPRGYIFGVELPQLENFEWARMAWDTESGGSIWKQALASGAYSDSYWAYLKAYWNLGVRRCNGMFVIRGLADVE